MRRPAVLYVTYDGLTDPLGQSQILPYLVAVAREVNLHVVSFEKRVRYQESAAEINAMLSDAGIAWHPLFFTVRPKVLAKVYDLVRMVLVGTFLALKYRCAAVHCRSYVAGVVGMFLKSLTSARFLFDIRGFWVDERVDSGNWDLNKAFYRWLFSFYKWLEKWLFRRSDQVITLTRASVPTIVGFGTPENSITVIPCCADFEHFRPDQRVREEVRGELGFVPDDVVLCYLGSLGSWYQFPEMLDFFSELHLLVPSSRFLLVTHDWRDAHERLVTKKGLRPFVVVRAATRAEVPRFTQAADLAVSFIRPSFSKSASSPTKLGEFLALGIPVVCNAGVGDVAELLTELDGGSVLTEFAPGSYRHAAENLRRILQCGGAQLRAAARERLGLEVARERYCSVYRKLLTKA